jgi:hypothetical protein
MSLMQMLLGARTPWTPASLSPALWLDASSLASLTINGSNQISQWNDLSGNARHVSQGSLSLMPTLSGSSVVFNGGQSLGRASYDITGLNDLTICVVANPSSAVAPTQQSIVRFQFGANPYFVYPWDNGRLISFQDVGPPGLSAGFVSGAVNIGVARRAINSASGLQTWNNGTAVASGATSSAAIQAGPLSIGSWNGAAEYFTGSVREVLIFHAALVAADRERLEGFLAWKWGVQTSLPLAHPYRNAPP